jgi:hypothetical protein
MRGRMIKHVVAYGQRALEAAEGQAAAADITKFASVGATLNIVEA